jgi:polyribonucleotide nucleotidyltransferase
MSDELVRESVEVGESTLSIETGGLAPQANGAALVRWDDTVLLVTACAAKPRPGLDFFPLTVEYRHRRAAMGRFNGGLRKREGRSSEGEILASRITDRTIRPLFPESYQADTQIIATVLSAQPDVDPDVFAVVGASAALMVSDIPWGGPAAALRLGRVGGKWIVFPREEQREVSSLDLVVSIGPDGLLMVEGQLQKVPEDVVVDALLFAEQTLKPVLAMQERLRSRAGRPKLAVSTPDVPTEITTSLANHETALANAYRIARKSERKEAVEAVKRAALEELSAGEHRELAAKAYDALEYRVSRQVIASGTRFDGRNFTQVRPLASRVSLLPRTHGSALFNRGETQALATCVLGTGGDRDLVDGFAADSKARFFLNYNFPPFSTGETKPLRGPGRREIGHGMLAQRALEVVLPGPETFPYTVRLISDILSSNGSSSMATVCAGCLAMLDAGVPLEAPVAGIAMGLIREGDQFIVLTDILGDEDHLGDMDFKVCGTETGITALQMDIKITGLTEAILRQALHQARDARLSILAHMKTTLAKHRPDTPAHAPKALSLRIDPARIGELIGPGGRNIRELQEETGAKIDIEDDGKVVVFGPERRSAEAAAERIRTMFRVPVVGEVFEATVKNVTDSFAFVELFAGTEAAVHVSDWSGERIPSLKEVARQGDPVTVKVLGVDPKGRVKASRKAAL